MEKFSLLLADDEDIIRSRVKLMLGSTFDICEASSAKQAFEEASKGFDVVLLDIMFPDGNGVDICRKIKEKFPHGTVIISSSMETLDAWNEAFGAGADSYLEKRELLNADPRKMSLMINSLVERNKLRKHAEDVNRKQAKLLSVLTHEVRAPFQALLGTMELLKKSDIPSHLSDNVDRMFESANQQLLFINSLLELLRLESGAVKIRPFLLDINLAINQSIQTLRTFATAKNIQIEARLHNPLPKVSGDLGQITRVVNNLLSNAIKFSSSGGKIVVQSREDQRQHCPGAVATITDQGIGFCEKELEQIFLPFYHGRSRGTNGEAGSGLGLSICKEIMDLHQGTIEVESSPGKGTTVRIWFPKMNHDKSKLN
ncbi:MAG: hybrid sensor histidine kinase/response regulator [Pseudomonadota bacterium]